MRQKRRSYILTLVHYCSGEQENHFKYRRDHFYIQVIILYMKFVVGSPPQSNKKIAVRQTKYILFFLVKATFSEKIENSFHREDQSKRFRVSKTAAKAETIENFCSLDFHLSWSMTKHSLPKYKLLYQLLQIVYSAGFSTLTIL